VYGSIVFLIYFVLLLLSKVESNKHAATKLVRELAIIESEKYSYTWDWVILIRVYNEAPVLLDTLNRVFDADSHIISLRHSQNRGWGAALETWFEYIRRYLNVDFVVTFDADGQHNIEDLEKFKLAFVKHPELDVLFGSRFFGNSAKQNIPLFRKIVLKLGRVFTRIISWAKLTDSHNGYRMFRMSAVKQIYLTADSMAYASELIEEIMKKSNAIFIAFHTIWSKFFK